MSIPICFVSLYAYAAVLICTVAVEALFVVIYLLVISANVLILVHTQTGALIVFSQILIAIVPVNRSGFKTPSKAQWLRCPAN